MRMQPLLRLTTRTMDALREYSHNMYGITKIPLLYVVCEQETHMDKPEGHWEDPLMQMINWAPHWILATGGVGAIRHLSYVVDNKMVFDKLAEYVARMVAGYISILSYIGAMAN